MYPFPVEPPVLGDLYIRTAVTPMREGSLPYASVGENSAHRGRESRRGVRFNRPPPDGC